MITTELTRVDYYLTIWAAWVRSYREATGYPPRSAGFHTGGSVRSFDDMVHQGEDYQARTVNGLIDSLPPAQQCAIAVNHLNDCWRFPRDNMDELYDAARGTLEMGLNRWGLP